VIVWLACLMAPTLFMLTVGLPTVAWAGHDRSENSHEAPLYYEAQSLNEGLPELDEPPDLTTPRATLINMLRASQDGDFERAARSLNFADIPKDQRDPARLAKHFYYVLTQQVQVDYHNVPDRPNGAFDKKTSSESNTDHAQELGERPRRSILVDDVPMSLGNVEIRLERFKSHDGDPIWLFSPRTVTKIEDMYKRHGPGPLFERLPYTIKQGLVRDSAGWQWVLLLGLITPAALIGWVVKKVLRRLFRWKFPQQALNTASLARPLAWLVTLVLFIVVTYVLVAPPGTIVHALYVVSTVLLVAGVTWVGVHLIDLLASLMTQKYRGQMSPYEGEEARLRLTSILVGRYALVFLAIAVGLGLTLYELHVIKNLSLSFLTSAGVASAILGVAAHGVLGNMLAAVQIAVTKPAAIGDSVNFEGNWGFVEDITYGYVAIRTWDDRRVIVPLSYFISHPFENWSKSNARILKPVYLYADYRVEVDQIRRKFRELLEQSEHWDRTTEPVLQVTGMSEKTIELRALCSAKNATDAWNLHCEIRESLVQYLRTMGEGRFLPKDRIEVSGSTPDRRPEVG
jgi:small-conductance mechanosensitive channel